MENRIIESVFISDHLDAKGFTGKDIIQVCPISGRGYHSDFKYKSLEFISESYPEQKERPWVKRLPNLSKEKFHIEISREQTIGRQSVFKERILCRSLDNYPFQINGIFSFQAFLERGDEIKLGHNKLIFKKKDIPLSLEKELITDEVAKSDILILIQGETGTGKSRLALDIHKQSERKGEYVHLNLSAYTQALLESELFGHMKGAFTGAMNDKKGVFEAAMGGTLFLDEIDSLSLEMQTKLLLFLDNKKFRPVGQVKERTTDARIIVASGRDLRPLVAAGKMRKDFYFRLASSHITKLIPLREDSFLIERFCEKISIEQNIILMPKLIDFYKSLPWPGNYRQLKNHILKKKVYSSGRKLKFDEYDEALILSSTDLAVIGERSEKIMTMKEMKEIYARNMYAKLQNNLNETAKALCLSAKSLRTLLKSA